MARIANTDKHWENTARENPYFEVLSDQKFRGENLGLDLWQEFFASGEDHVAHVLRVIRAKINPSFTPNRILDYGCGVGRLVVPFADQAPEVVGIDVSQTMLAHARVNCEKFGLSSVRLIHYDDLKSLDPSSFDLIHSYIVFQHIPIVRGEAILRELIALLRVGGVGAVHFTFCDTQPALRRFLIELRDQVPFIHGLINLARGRRFSTGRNQMNSYSLNRILRILFEAGCSNLHIEFSKHQIHIGAMIYFEKSMQALL